MRACPGPHQQRWLTCCGLSLSSGACKHAEVADLLLLAQMRASMLRWLTCCSWRKCVQACRGG
eukprot:1159183-Pelagomonas_calceolata.AAC.8